MDSDCERILANCMAHGQCNHAVRIECDILWLDEFWIWSNEQFKLWIFVIDRFWCHDTIKRTQTKKKRTGICYRSLAYRMSCSIALEGWSVFFGKFKLTQTKWIIMIFNNYVCWTGWWHVTVNCLIKLNANIAFKIDWSEIQKKHTQKNHSCWPSQGPSERYAFQKR